jgi:hypothetical protein
VGELSVIRQEAAVVSALQRLDDGLRTGALMSMTGNVYDLSVDTKVLGSAIAAAEAVGRKSRLLVHVLTLARTVLEVRHAILESNWERVAELVDGVSAMGRSVGTCRFNACEASRSGVLEFDIERGTGAS